MKEASIKILIGVEDWMACDISLFDRYGASNEWRSMDREMQAIDKDQIHFHIPVP